VSHHIL